MLKQNIFVVEYESSSSDEDNDDNTGVDEKSRRMTPVINNFTRMLALEESSSKYESLVDNRTCARMNNVEQSTFDGNQIGLFLTKIKIENSHQVKDTHQMFQF